MKKSFTEKNLPWNEILKEEAFDGIENRLKNTYRGGVLQCKNGALGATFLFEAGDYNLSFEVQEERRNIFSEFLSDLKDNYTLYFSTKRDHSSFRYVSKENEMTGTAKEVEKLRKNLFTYENSFENKTYVTLTYSPIKANEGLSKLLFREFLEVLSNLELMFKRINALAHILKGEELLSFLRSEITLKDENTLLPFHQSNLAESLSTVEVSLNSIPLTIDNDSEKTYVRCISFNDLPYSTFPDMLLSLYSMPMAFKTVCKFSSLSKENGEKALLQRKKQYRSSLFSLKDHMRAEFKGREVDSVSDAKQSALYRESECTECLSLISSSKENVGYATVIIIVYSNDEDELEENLGYMKTALGKMGFLTKTETIGNSLLFFSSIVNFESSFRSKLMLSKNYADMLHLNSPYKGAVESSLIQKRFGENIPLVYGKNLDGSPYYLSLSGRSGEKGHTFISGPTGSGKSVFLALLIASYQKFRNARTVIIDRDLSSLNIVRGNGGKIYYPLHDASHFKPLSSKKKERASSLMFLKSVCIAGGVEWTSEIEEEATEALSLLTKGHESISTFHALLKGINKRSSLAVALSPYIKGGPYETLFDNEEDTLCDFSGITLIETNRVLQGSGSKLEGLQIPTMIHILSRLESAFNDSVPTLLIMDEAWKFLKNETFKNYLEEWIKTLRKKNVDIVFSITNTSDIRGTSIAETVLSNTETRIFMSDRAARETLQKEGYKSMGLGDKEIDILCSAPSFCPIIMQEGTIGVVDFELASQLPFLVTTEEDKKKFLCENE